MKRRCESPRRCDDDVLEDILKRRPVERDWVDNSSELPSSYRLIDDYADNSDTDADEDITEGLVGGGIQSNNSIEGGFPGLVNATTRTFSSHRSLATVGPSFRGDATLVASDASSIPSMSSPVDSDSSAQIKAQRIVQQAIEQSETTIDLRNMGLRKLPADIGDLNNIIDPAPGKRFFTSVTLDASQNLLTELPTALLDVTSLETLVVSNNQLKSVPPKIGRLPHLRNLGLYNNPLKYLPCELLDMMPQLKMTTLSHEWVVSPPQEVLRLQARPTNPDEHSERDASEKSHGTETHGQGVNKHGHHLFYAHITLRHKGPTRRTLKMACLRTIVETHVMRQYVDSYLQPFDGVRAAVKGAIADWDQGITCGVCKLPIYTRTGYYAHIYEFWSGVYETGIPWRRDICSAKCYNQWTLQCGDLPTSIAQKRTTH